MTWTFDDLNKEIDLSLEKEFIRRLIFYKNKSRKNKSKDFDNFLKAGQLEWVKRRLFIMKEQLTSGYEASKLEPEYVKTKLNDIESELKHLEQFKNSKELERYLKKIIKKAQTPYEQQHH